ncbi:MAG: arginine--tRNA ligase [Acutalibacteraceae bacterium]
MSKLVEQSTANLRTLIIEAIGKAITAGQLPSEPIPDFTIEVPADRSHGDWAANVAMVSAKAFKLAPRKIAEAVASHIVLDNSYFKSCEIAGPGFLNFFLNEQFYVDVVKEVIAEGDNYGHSDFGQNKKVMIEFVSANPTGPMHMGNARGGALGDCLASVMSAAGYDVWREFYVNDAGNQIEKFGNSLEARYLQMYSGRKCSFLKTAIRAKISKTVPLNLQQSTAFYPCGFPYSSTALIEYALPHNIEKMQKDLKKYGITYDQWFLESTIHKNGELQETIEELTKRGYTYEKDGALWYKATEFGSDKDDVLVRQNGNPTYFAADIAYHRNKFVKRGFDLCIDIWGADHHGHVARMKGAMEALGLDSSKLDVILMQLVRLTQNGEVVRMSKRTGKAIQLGDLLDEVPVDSARFLFNMREANSQMEFDLDLAVKQDSQNPVYYVQYARARICSILKALAADGITPYPCTDEELRLLTAPAELELIRHLSAYTSEIIEAAKDYDPARITRYVITLATLFHKFYDACRVKGDNPHLTNARLTLCIATSTVICNVLNMFKISTPESM